MYEYVEHRKTSLQLKAKKKLSKALCAAEPSELKNSNSIRLAGHMFWVHATLLCRIDHQNERADRIGRVENVLYL